VHSYIVHGKNTKKWYRNQRVAIKVSNNYEPIER